MNATTIAPNVYAISLGFVNVFLIDAQEITLIDSGIPGSEKRILQAIAELGYSARDLRHILVTHLHYDHTGSLEQLKQASGATIYMHALDAAAFTSGEVMRTIEPAPGLLNRLVVNNLTRRASPSPATPAVIDQTITGITEIPGTGGIQAIPTPGHTAGHIAYYWPKQNGILFVGDAASNMLHLGYSFLYENFSQGRQTLVDIGRMKFNTACFSHGKMIRDRASNRFYKTFRA